MHNPNSSGARTAHLPHPALASGWSPRPRPTLPLTGDHLVQLSLEQLKTGSCHPEGGGADDGGGAVARARRTVHLTVGRVKRQRTRESANEDEGARGGHAGSSTNESLASLLAMVQQGQHQMGLQGLPGAMGVGGSKDMEALAAGLKVDLNSLLLQSISQKMSAQLPTAHPTFATAAAADSGRATTDASAFDQLAWITQQMAMQQHKQQQQQLQQQLPTELMVRVCVPSRRPSRNPRERRVR